MLIITANIANVDARSVFNLFKKSGYLQADINVVEDGVDEQEFRKLTDGTNNYVLQLTNLTELQQFTRQQLASSRVVIFYFEPQLMLAQLLAEPHDVENIRLKLQEWYDLSSRALEFYKKNRAGCSIINFNDCIANPHAFINLITPESSVINTQLIEIESVKPTEVSLWVAQQLLLKMVEINRLYAELEACSIEL